MKVVAGTLVMLFQLKYLRVKIFYVLLVMNRNWSGEIRYFML